MARFGEAPNHRIIVAIMAGYSIVCTAFVVSLLVRGPYSPEVVGSMADWVAGLGTVVALSLAIVSIHQVRLESLHERRLEFRTEQLLRALDAALAAASGDSPATQIAKALNLLELAAPRSGDFNELRSALLRCEDLDRSDAEVQQLIEAIYKQLQEVLQIDDARPYIGAVRVEITDEYGAVGRVSTTRLTEASGAKS